MTQASLPPAESDTHPSPPLLSVDRVVPVDLAMVLRRTLVIGLSLALLLGGLMLAHYRMESGNNLRLIEADRDRVLNLVGQAMRQELASALSDLRFLARHHEPRAYLAADGRDAARQLSDEYSQFLLQKRNYDRVRLLDLAGNERIRVDRAEAGVRVVPAAQLKSQQGRYYFQALSRLGPGEIYVSPLDLGVEGGRVKLPARPMIRLGMPLFDRAGNRRGYLLLNYRAERMFGCIQLINGPNRDFWLLNREGYWLIGPAPEAEWGFMFPERGQSSFAARYPQAWRQMDRAGAGVADAAGLRFKFQRIAPLSPGPGSVEEDGLAQPVDRDGYQWTLVSLITPAAVGAYDDALARRLAWIYGGLMLVVLTAAAGVSWVSARQQTLKRFLERGVDNVPMLLGYVDAAERYRFNNRTYLEWLGVAPRQLYGRKLGDVLGEDFYRRIEPHVRAALAGRRADFELRVEFKHGGPRDVTVTYMPDVDADQAVQGFYVVAGDISRYKETERRERLHLQELAQVSRLASVSEVTTEIAHQINQPLAAITNFSAAILRTLRNGGDLANVPEWLEQITAQVERAAEMVRHMRRFGRHGEGSREEVSLNDLARDVVALMEPGARRQGADICLDLDGRLPAVVVERALIEQVIFNLLRNALEALAGAPEPRRADIRTAVQGAGVYFEVADTGPGVPADFAQHAFESFITYKTKGLGIGLAVSRSIIEAHGGSIQYANRPQGGAVFSFYLPGANREQ